MSIFKESFKQGIRSQLDQRQAAINNRTPQNLQYFNSRNAWIRMSSSVNTWIDKTPLPDPNLEPDKYLEELKKPGNYDNTLAKQYILQGGTLTTDGKLKSGLGTFDRNTYSNIAADGTPYRLGIRPMPGITSMEVKSKGAYGSLQEVTVHFQAWDIKQLEDLELLYMRPGYTVLIEWGWSPYLDSTGKYQANAPVYYDIITNFIPKEQIWKDLEKKSTETYAGNVESMFGYIKNYSWTARMDGGYDCTVNILSLGEVLESLKVNYLPGDVLSTVSSIGLLSPNVTKYAVYDTAANETAFEDKTWDISTMNLSSSYTKNILAGLFEEIWEMGKQADPGTNDDGKSIILKDTVKNLQYNLFHKTINIGTNSDGDISKTDEQIYITLGSLVDILNNYVLLRERTTESSGSALAKLSVYDKDNNPLLCSAHPLQLSMDPSVCLIKNTLWTGGLKFNAAVSNTAGVGTPPQKFPCKRTDDQINLFLNTIINNSIPVNGTGNGDEFVRYINDFVTHDKDGNLLTDQTDITNIITHINNIYIYKYFNKPSKFTLLNPDDKQDPNFNKTKAGVGSDKTDLKGKNIADVYDTYNNFKSVLGGGNGVNLGSEKINKALTAPGVTAAKTDKAADNQGTLQKQVSDLNDSQDSGIDNIKFLNNLEQPYFLSNNPETELGIIDNIYINVTMLYNLSVDNSVAGQDSKEKNEIAVYDFIKNILAKISESIGNVSNFELFIDPNESVGRIIDINYVDTKSPEDVWSNAFILNVQSLDSIVRSYKLESKIFPNQSAQVAIGAQVGGGALGVDASSLIAFNKRIRDRIIPIKDAPTSPTISTDPKSQINILAPLIKTIYSFFGKLSTGLFQDADFDPGKAGDYKNALKDLIQFFANISDSKIKNRAIIPTVFSADLDGLGGIIIGNIFRIPDEVLPKGYKGLNGPGSKLGYVVTGLGHTLQNGDWVTHIDAQTIILDKPTGQHIDYSQLNLNFNPNGTSTIGISVDGKGIVKAATTTTTSTPPSTGGTTKVINGVTYTNGQIENLLVPIRSDLYSRHYSSINQSDKKQIRLQAKAMTNLQNMLIDAYNAGIYIKVNSAYRTYDDQVRIAAEATKIPAAKPGRSNHGFGLAVDLANSSGTRINPIDTPKEWAWIQANKSKYNWDNNTPRLNTTSESHHYNFMG